jgi:hypothetical protein
MAAAASCACFVLTRTRLGALMAHPPRSYKLLQNYLKHALYITVEGLVVRIQAQKVIRHKSVTV